MRRIALVVLLIFSVTPMASEMTEFVLHMIEHGDLAHSIDGEHDDGQPEDEHGCSSMFHTCGCHSSSPSTLAAVEAWRPAVVAPSNGLQSLAPAASHGRDSEAPPHRPPIA